MRGARWLLLMAMLAIVGGVAFTYRTQKRVLQEEAPPKPPALPADLNSSANQWHWTEHDSKGCKTATIAADDFRQVKDSSRVDLKDVSLKLFKPCGETFNLVQSAAASFYSDQHRLYSDGDVSITLNEPDDGLAKPDLVSIHSSGVAFDSNSGHADTDRLSTFTFRSGNGRATGAAYDPTTRELFMKKDVEVNFHPKGPNAKPMKIEAATMTYYEARSQVALPDWGRLTRNQTVVEGHNSMVYLDDGVIRQVATHQAEGTDAYPNRNLEYAADNLSMEFDEDGVVKTVTGQGHAHLVATSASSQTTIAAPQVELSFEAENGEGVLTRVVTTGDGTLTSKPLPVPGQMLGETHVLRSNNIQVQMRPGGREIATLVTHAPGRLEFLPNLPAQHHRTLDGMEMVITYGQQNRIESFHSTEVKTVTDPSAEERKRNPDQTITSSREMTAHFTPGTSRISTMEQTGDFIYAAGDRHARAAKATLDSDNNVMLLETGARMWDSTGSTTADHIRMDERTGNFTAEGSVKSSRLPDSKSQQGSGMLSGDEPMEAQADKMVSTDHNQSIHYEGHATVWQGANRIQAKIVDVERKDKKLIADGNVVSNLWEQPKDDDKQSSGAPVLMLVHAAHLVYTDQDRLAIYSGGVQVNRPGMQVKSHELRAYLADSGADSRLEKAFADGGVEIVEKAPDRTRTGTADHAEYYPDDERVILRGGKPALIDSLKGDAHGVELTYFANDDRLLVNGSAGQPAHSRIRRK